MAQRFEHIVDIVDITVCRGGRDCQRPPVRAGEGVPGAGPQTLCVRASVGEPGAAVLPGRRGINYMRVTLDGGTFDLTLSSFAPA